MPSSGTTNIRIMETIIPSLKTVIQGTVNDMLYLSLMALTESRATSEALLRSLSLVSRVPYLEAAIHRSTVFLYPRCGSRKSRDLLGEGICYTFSAFHVCSPDGPGEQLSGEPVALLVTLQTAVSSKPPPPPMW